jgi:mannose-6-phosphate isomerase-like protein (cupin superfamily)
MRRNPPHGGEVHPDGDEILYLISGGLDVILEEADGDRKVTVKPGEAIVVPKGVWHRVELREPSHLLFITPGPGGAHRPLPRR